jgi:hypothetical protein
MMIGRYSTLELTSTQLGKKHKSVVWLMEDIYTWPVFNSDIEDASLYSIPGVLTGPKRIDFLDYIEENYKGDPRYPLHIFRHEQLLDLHKQPDISLAQALVQLHKLFLIDDVHKREGVKVAIINWELMAHELASFLYGHTDFSPSPHNCKMTEPSAGSREQLQLSLPAGASAALTYIHVFQRMWEAANH